MARRLCKHDLVMRGGSGAWLPSTVAIAVPSTIAIVMIVWDLQGNGGSLGSSAVGVQNAYATGMLVTGPVCHKYIQVVLEGTASLYQLTIHQQMCSWLYIVAGDVDDGMSIGMCRQDDFNALQEGDVIAQAPKFTSRQQALW